MLSGAMQSANWLAVAVMVISTVLNAGYFLPIVFRAFFRPVPAAAHGHDHPHGEAPWPVVFALTATAAGAIALFLFPDTPLALSKMMIGK
jgi:multicomponent Na+:H+ antiporter subunit D